MWLDNTRGEKSRSAKLTKEQAQAILDLKGSAVSKDVAKQFSVSLSTVQGIWARRTWTDLKKSVVVVRELGVE